MRELACPDLREAGELGRRILLWASTTKTRQALWVDLPDVAVDALRAPLMAKSLRKSGVIAERSPRQACSAEIPLSLLRVLGVSGGPRQSLANAGS